MGLFRVLSDWLTGADNHGGKFEATFAAEQIV